MFTMTFRLTRTLVVCLALLMKLSVNGVNGQEQVKICPLDAKIGDACDNGQGMCAPPGQGEKGPNGRLKCYAAPGSTCTQTVCGSLPDTDNGYYVLDDITNVGVNATASLHCCDNYNTTGEVLVCGDDGQWSAVGETCSRISDTCDTTGLYNYMCRTDLTGFTCDQGMCPSGWSLVGDSCYIFDTVARPWCDAQRSCSATTGGHLANINTETESTAIIAFYNSHYQDDAQFWTGGRDVCSNEIYYWTDGSLLSDGFENWKTNQPDNWQGTDGEDCMLMVTGGWNDVSCLYYRWSLCEKELNCEI